MVTTVQVMNSINLTFDKDNPHRATVRVTDPHLPATVLTDMLTSSLPKGGENWWITSEHLDREQDAWILDVEWSE